MISFIQEKMDKKYRGTGSNYSGSLIQFLPKLYMPILSCCVNLGFLPKSRTPQFQNESINLVHDDPSFATIRCVLTPILMVSFIELTYTRFIEPNFHPGNPGIRIIPGIF